MRTKNWNLALRLRATSPGAIPMARLSEYMREFAALLGSTESVRFAGVVKGSALLRADVLPDALPAAQARLALASSADAPESLRSSVRTLDSLMAGDGIHGEVITDKGSVVIAFPGAKKRTIPRTPIVVTQDDELTGTVVRIGGKDDTVPLLVQDVDGRYYDANIAGRDLAREIGMHLFRDPIRIHGHATWSVDDNDEWRLLRFKVTSFEELDDSPIDELFTKLAEIPGNGWSGLDDPVEEWKKIRG